MGGWYRRFGKRCLDITLAAAGLAFFALPMVWMAWRIRRELGVPVIFRQTRVGHEGKLFLIFKFRTMNPGGKEAPTAFSRWLRATAMDELPQLLNILKGEMSFVGPRPVIPDELADLDAVPRGKERLRVRPGLAGMAQLYSTKVPSLPERIQRDVSYVEQCSLPKDVAIILRSVAVTLRGAWERPGPKVTRG